MKGIMVSINDAVKLRENGKTYPQISEALGCSVSWCKSNLKHVKVLVKVKNPIRKCDLYRLLDGSYESFYWLGFLMADGHFSNKNRLKIIIAEKDKDHLEKLQKFLNVERVSLTEINGNKYLGFSAMDTYVISTLKAKYSIASSKTLNPCDISSLSGDQLFCLSIGFIDGDGCIDIQHKRVHAKLRIKCHSSWIDNLQYMYPESKIAINKQGYASASISDTTKLAELKQKAIDLNLPIMKRKWDIIDLAFKSKQQRTKNNMPIIVEMLELGYSQTYIGGLLGYSSSGLSTILKRSRANGKHILNR